jgi:hypothetical protein
MKVNEFLCLYEFYTSIGTFFVSIVWVLFNYEYHATNITQWGQNLVTRRKAVNTNVLEKLIQKHEQPVKDFQQAAEEFFRHSRIKGLSPDTVKFYQRN